jgi:predicted glycogen debranching enzyme
MPPTPPVPPDDLERMLAREWLETNGLGSYASASVSGAGTRRYHGLLVAALDPPVRRHVLLSRLEEVLLVDGEPFPLSTNVYRGAVHPAGYRAIVHFEARPVPTWHLSAGGVELERRVWMPQGRQAVAVGYDVLKAPARARVGLAVRPLVAFRGFHGLSAENGALDPGAEVADGRVSVRPYDELPWLHLHHNAERFDPEPLWYRDFEYRVELERGFEARENHSTRRRDA